MNVKRFSAWSIGLLTGVLLTLALSSWANREAPPLKELRIFADVLDVVQRTYVQPPDPKKLITEAIRGMVASLDPHSAYLDSEEYQELQVGTQGEFGGLGIEVTMEDGFVKVVAPIEGTPAARAGLQAGDLVVKIDEQVVKGMTLREAVKRMRGKPGTTVTLQVLRSGSDKPFTVVLTREIIKVRSVRLKRAEEGILYVRITHFQENTAVTLAEELRRATKEGEIRGIILDLRNDPGGLLHTAIGVAAAFLPPDSLVVRTDGRLADAKREYRARAEDYLRGADEQRDYLARFPKLFREVPMAVLINAGSASASEIVAGALQDHGRAKLFGEKSFGKGSVQTILPLADGTALKLTTALYYTPKGRSIQAEGIEPDFAIAERPEGSRKRLREANLRGHLEVKEGGIRRDESGVRVDEESSSALKAIEFGSAEDRQYLAAIHWLRYGSLPEWAAAEAAQTAAAAK